METKEIIKQLNRIERKLGKIDEKIDEMEECIKSEIWDIKN